MATAFQGLSVGKGRGASRLYSYQINTASLKTGAAVVADTSVSGQMVKAPGGAAAKGFQGLIFTEYEVGAAGSAVGNDVELQRDGIGEGILASGQAINYGDRLVIAGTDGSLRAYNDGVDTNCDIVGTSEMTLSTVSINTPIPVNLDKFTTVP